MKVTCDKHPGYKAIYKPRAKNCASCWIAYFNARIEHLERMIDILEARSEPI